MADSQIKVEFGDSFTVEHHAATADVGVYIAGTKVLGAQQATIADAVVAHDVNATFSDTEVEAALDALGTKINAILTALEAHGILASA